MDLDGLSHYKHNIKLGQQHLLTGNQPRGEVEHVLAQHVRPKGMTQQSTGNLKQILPYLGNMAQAKSRKCKGYKERGNPNTCPRKVAQREGERENHFRGASPPNLLNIALCGLVTSCLNPCPFCLHLGGCTLAPKVHAPCVYMQRQKKHRSRQARKKQKEIGRAFKEHTNKESQTRANKASKVGI